MVQRSATFIFILTHIYQLVLGQSAHDPFPGPPTGYVEEDVFDPAWLADPMVQLGFFPVTLTGATPNNSSDDDTDAINHAIRLARDYRYVCFFPAGTYHVTNTILGAFKSYEFPFGPDGNRWRNDRLRPVQLVGDCSGDHPVIKLKNNSAGFTDPNPTDLTMKPLLHIWAQLVSSANTLCIVDGNTFEECQGHQDPDYESAASNFNAWVRNLDFDLGSGNTNAVGIRLAGAQGCMLENSVIDVNDGYAGFTGGLGSSSGYYNITVNGGKYGFVSRDPQVTSNLFITGGQFINQTEAVFRGASWFPYAFVGIYIKKNNPRIFDVNVNANETRFNRAGGFVSTRGVSFIDAVIDITVDNNDAAFLLNNGNNFYLENVYVKNVEKIVGSVQGATYLSGVGNSTDWRHIESYAHFRPTNPPQYVLWDYGSTLSSSDSLKVVSYDVPASEVDAAALIENHISPLVDAPCFLDGDVTTFSYLNGRDNVDDHAALQQLIDAGGKLFIPRGNYRISAPLVLKSNTVLFGASNTATVIYADSSMHLGAAGVPMVSTVSDPAGNAVLADLYLQDDALASIGDPSTNNNKLSYIEWKQGANSVVKDVVIGANWFYSNLSPQLFEDVGYIKISEGGGGKWYNVTGEHTKLRDLSRLASHRAFLVENTTEPLFIYSLNWERAGTDDLTSAQIEFRNASNITTYCFKTETGGAAGVGSISPASIPLLINNSFNVALHQVTGKIDSIVQTGGHVAGMVEIINNSCDITLSTVSAYATKGPQYSIKVDGIGETALDVDLGNGQVAAFWVNDGTYCYNPKVVLAENSICILETQVEDIFRINGIIGNYTVEILNLSEQVLQSLSGSNSIDIDLTTLPAGMYFVRITRQGNAVLSAQINLRD